MKHLLALLTAAPLVTGCMVSMESNNPPIGSSNSVGNGTVVIEERILPSFQTAETHGDMDILILEGNSYEASVTLDGNLQGYLRTSVQGGNLIVDFTRPVRTSVRPTVTITVPALEAIHHYGSGLVTVEHETWRHEMIVDVVGNGSLVFTGAAERLVATHLGTGTLELIGYADVLEASVESSGDLLGDGMLAADVIAKVYGSGDVTLDLDYGSWVNASIYGSGNVEWWGFPTKTVYTMSGSGRIIEHRILGKAAAGSIAQKFKALKPKG